MKKIEELFEAELHRRSIAFEIESESGRYAIELGGGRFLASLDNLARDFARDEDTERISRFISTIEDTAKLKHDSYRVENLYWVLEPNDYEEKADFRVPVSDRVDRVLAHLSPEVGGII